MCPECGRTMAQGHATGCRNGPQLAPRTIPFGASSNPVRSCPECSGGIVLESRSGLMQCAQNHHWNSHGRIIGGPTYYQREREAQARDRGEGPPRDIMPEGTRVSRNRYERVQRFPGPNGTVIENPQASTDGVTWINEPWEAMQAFRQTVITATEVALRQEEARQRAAAAMEDAGIYGTSVTEMVRENMNRMLTQQQQEAFLAEINRMIMPPVITSDGTGEQVDLRPGGVIRTGLPRVAWSTMNFTPDPPRTSADTPSDRPRQSHSVMNLPRGDAPGDGVRYRCSCGWVLTEAWLVGVSALDLRGTIEAHCAGGQVGPQQKKIVKMRLAITCYNCEKRPDIKLFDFPDVAGFVCCDGEIIMKPRRHFKLELDS